jgi:hypothetical protein
MPSVVYNTIGIIGDILVLTAFFSIQAGKIKAVSLIYPIMNLSGSLCILFSLFYAWNLSAAVMQSAWVLISIYGLVKYFSVKKI